MILRNNLYTVIRKEETSGGISYVIRLNPDHFIYEAHFPGEPVTPGVCILQLAQELLALEINEHLELKKIKNAKFTAVISPDQLTELTVAFPSIEIGKEEVACQCVISNIQLDLIYAKLSIICRKHERYEL